MAWQGRYVHEVSHSAILSELDGVIGGLRGDVFLSAKVAMSDQRHAKTKVWVFWNEDHEGIAMPTKPDRELIWNRQTWEANGDWDSQLIIPVTAKLNEIESDNKFSAYFAKFVAFDQQEDSGHFSLLIPS